MTRQNWKLGLLIAAVAALAAPSAFAGVHFGIFGGVDYPFGSDPTLPNTNGALGYGGGLDIDFGLGPSVGLDFMPMYRYRNASVLGTTQGRGEFHVPAYLRFGMHPLSLGIGGYYSTGISNSSYNDYGLSGSVRLMFPGPTSFFIEAQYDYGLKTGVGQSLGAPSDPNGRNSEILGLIGIHFH